MANSSVAKLAAVVPLLIIIIILPCVLASRTVGPQPADNVVDGGGNAPTTRTKKNLSFLPIRGGVVMMNNRTARAEDNCSDVCDDHSCQTAFPNLCGPQPDPNYCWVGCLCIDHFHNYCTCLCTAA